MGRIKHGLSDGVAFYGLNIKVILDTGLVKCYSMTFISSENRKKFVKSIIKNGGYIKEELRELVFIEWDFDDMMTELKNLRSDGYANYEVIL